MSIKILGIYGNDTFFVENYKYFFQSKYEDEYELTYKDFHKLDMLYNLYDSINLYLYDKSKIDVRVSSGFRTKKINKLVGGSPTSQHLHFEAMDLHFYKNNKRIRGHEVMEGIAELIDEVFSDFIIQMFWYDWGIHIGLATARTKITKRRGAR
jgi:hypothetical protein